MKQDLPNIGDILKNINDPDLLFVENPNKADKTEEGSKTKKQKDEVKPKAIERKQLKSSVQGQDTYWESFISHLRHIEEDDEKLNKKEFPIVRLAPILAATLDECNIGNCSRSDIVNAIVHSFLDLYMAQLMPYRTNIKKRTLFENYKPTKQ